MKTIGIAIPCFIKHIDKCLELLDSINTQTRVPEEVVVSCSSSKETDFPIKEYKFKLRVITSEERKNTGQNRNIAGRNLTTDVICFFDADDIMHPQRIEILGNAFEANCDIVLHSFFFGDECKQNFPNIEQPIMKKNIMSKCYSGCILVNYGARIAHGHVSVKRQIFDQVSFPEDPIYETKADCVFCYGVFSLPNIQTIYLDHPLSKYVPSGTCIQDDFRVWCIWIGGYQMTQARKECFESIKNNIGVPVTLVTDDNMHEYILKDHPLHEGYQYLSGLTKCDYFRAYLMHFYGGGYTDIKRTSQSWLPIFKELYGSNKMVCGYKEMDKGGVANVEPDDPDLQIRLRENWEKLVGNGAFICKPRTKFTEEWFTNLHTVMDKLLPALKENPAKHQRDCIGHYINGGYSKFPVRWAQVAGCIFHPLCLKYSDQVLQSLPMPSLHNYM